MLCFSRIPSFIVKFRRGDDPHLSFMVMQRRMARKEGAKSEEILHLGIMMVVCVSISVFISVCSLQLNSVVLDV